MTNLVETNLVETTPPTRPSLGPTGRVLLLSAGLLSLAVVLMLTVLTGRAVLDPELPGGSGVLLIGFGLAEICVVRLRVLRHEQIVTLAEVPYALGLLVVSPVHLVLVRAAGALITFVLVRRRLSLKVVFNTALWLAEAAVAATVVSLLAGTGVNWGPQTWLIVIVGVLAGPGLLSPVATTVVIGLYEDQGDLRACVRAAGEQLLTSTVVVVPALLGVEALHDRGSSLWLLVPTLIILVAVYRYIASLHERHAALLRVHHFTHELSATSDPDAVVRVVLHQVRTLLGVAHAEMTVRALPGISTTVAAALSADGELRLATTADVDGEPATLTPPLPHPRTGHDARLIRRRQATREDRSWLDNRGLREAIVAPLRSGETRLGALVVAVGPREVRSFGSEDTRLLASVAEQASVALRHAELVQQLRHDSNHDSLTGLANRVLLHRAVTASLAAGPASAVNLDLDGFKEVNDGYGHATGDYVLMEVAKRLLEISPPTAVVARIGGDEFAVLLPGVSIEDAELIGADMRAAVEQPVTVGGEELGVGVSVGVASIPRRGSPETLLRRADLAMYAAKNSDHGPVAWEPRLDGRATNRVPLLGELRKAMREDDIRIALQPQIEPLDGTLLAVEALVRWSLPTLGTIAPEQTVATAERGGIMTELTLRVLGQALAAVCVAQDAGIRMGVSVNLSARDLASTRLVGEVQGLLLSHGVEPERLTMELTETSVLADVERATQVLGALKDVGVQLSLDDFGTGWSSLQQLQRLPVDELKVDRSFVRDVTVNNGSAAIVRSVIDLGRNLGMRVIAEGVEDEATLAWLARAGCGRVQGYYVARPLTLAALVQWQHARTGATSARIG